MARSSWWALALAVGLAALLAVPSLPSALGSSPGSPGPTPHESSTSPFVSLNATLNVGSGQNLSPLFWGTTNSPRAHLIPNLGDLTSGTPVNVVVWPGAFAGDDFNPLVDNGSGTIWNNYNAQSHPSTNESAFVAWCRSINCTAIFQVPGEIDNASIAADVVAYTVNQTYIGPMWNNGVEVQVTMPGLDFRPAYWEIGNEPALWYAWGKMWGQWNCCSTPDSAQYALEENAYVRAMDAANTSYVPRIIGLPGIGRADSLDPPSSWVDDVIAENGPNLSGIADHIYPARNLPSGAVSLEQFYEQIATSNPSSLPSRVGDYESAIETACETYRCGPDGNSSLPVFVTEVGTSLSHSSFGGFSATFPGAIGMAVEVIQGMTLPNTTAASLDLYLSVANTQNSWFDLQGLARPTYTLYARIFTHLGSEAFSITPSGDSNLSAIATVAPHDADRRDLLFVNDNTTDGATFGTSALNSSSYAPGPAPLPAFAAGSPVEAWTWNASTPAYNATVGLTTSDPGTPVPVATFFPHGLPSSWTLPPQSLVLFETYNVPAYPVNFTASLNVPGFAPVSHWFILVDGAQTASTEPSLTLLLTTGPHSTRGLPLQEPPNGTDARARLIPDLPPTLNVGFAPMRVNFSFQLQWGLILSWNASRGSVLAPEPGGGTGTPSNGGLTWWNNSQPMTLQFIPAPGYAFDRWDGEGSGNFSGYGPTATVTPTGLVEEQAVFLPGTPVVFDETGLPTGTLWNVIVRGVGLSSATSSITFYELNGTWSDQVANVSGYQLITPGQAAWWQNTLIVGTTPMVVPVNFTQLDPVGPFYAVTFLEQGVPTGESWEVTVRGSTLSTNAPTPLVFDEHPSAYAFTAGAAGGYVLLSPLSFTLTDSRLTILVVFAPQNKVIWNESGLGSGLNWSVRVDGTPAPGLGGWATDRLLNGSYSFTIPGVQDYVPTPQYGTLDLTGSGAFIDVTFVRATFSVTFDVVGLPVGAQYRVRLSNASEVTELGSYGFRIPNGTYTFDLTAPTGYYPSPSHGNVTVSGRPTVISISLLPVGPGEPPVMWLLTSAATTAIALGLAAGGMFLLLGAFRRRTAKKSA